MCEALTWSFAAVVLGGDGGRGDPTSGKVDATGEHGEYHTMVGRLYAPPSQLLFA